MAENSSEDTNDSAASSIVPDLKMEQLIRISISDLTQLLTERLIKIGCFTLKMAPTRLVCNIDDCTWQSSDIIELDSHVQKSHNGTSCKPGSEVRQIILSENELQKLAGEGTAIIEGERFEVVRPVRFLFSIRGGRWYSQDRERIYDIDAKLSAKEARFLEKLQELENKHAEELARRDESSRAEQEAKEFARSRMEQLEQEIAEIGAASEKLQTHGFGPGIQSGDEQKPITSKACMLQDVTEVGLASSTHLRGEVSREFADIMKGVMEHLGEDQAKQKMIIQNQSNQITVQLQQISSQVGELRIKNIIIEAIVPVYQRFFVRVEKAFPRPSTYDARRDERHKSTIDKGNDAAHHANFTAHLSLCKGKHLSEVDIGTFEKIYGFHPNTYASILRPESLVEMYDMMGTIAAMPYRLKYMASTYAVKHKDFLAHADAIAKIRDTFERVEGKESEASEKCGRDPELLDNLQKMRVIYKQFLEYDKRDREN